MRLARTAHGRGGLPRRGEDGAVGSSDKGDAVEKEAEGTIARNEACLEEANGDAAFIAKALGDIARAKGMAQVARDAGLSRESLYKALSGERSPSFDTILKVIGALGLKLHAEASRS